MYKRWLHHASMTITTTIKAYKKGLNAVRLYDILRSYQFDKSALGGQEMTRWIKIAGKQYLGFWTLGLILFALQEVPYMVMPLFELSNNPIMNMQESSMILDIVEKILGSLCIAIMTFIVQENAPLFRIGNGISKIGFIAAIVVLLLNFFGWGLYFYGYQSVWIMMFFIVALPPLYYVCIGLWRGNWPLLATGALFEIVHFTHVFGNLTI